MKQKNKQLSESLYENDLQWLVSDTMFIDMHKTKLGSDAEYLVLGLAVNDKNPATDLAQFLESSTQEFIDIEVSPGMDSVGRYIVYVELERNPELYTTVKGILEDVSKLSGIDDWKFKSMGMNADAEFTEELFNSHVILTPDEYSRAHPQQTEQQDDDKDVEADQPKESVTESIKQRLKFLVSY